MVEIHSDKSLVGRRFSGNLDHSVFVNCDMRGTIFTDTSLKGATFSNVIFGLSDFQAILIAGISLFTNTVLVAILQLIGQRSFSVIYTNSNSIAETQPENVCIALAISAIIVIFACATIHKGLEFSSVCTVGTVLIFVGLALLYRLIELISTSINGSNSSITIGDLISSFLRFIVGNITGLGIVVVAVIIAITISVITIIYDTKKSFLPVVCINISTILIVASWQHNNGMDKTTIGVSLIIVIAGILLGYYVSNQLRKEVAGYDIVSKISIFIASIGGTNFFEADLTEATFNSTVVKNTDFRRAKITRTSWIKVKGLNFALVGDNYLNYKRVRKLISRMDGEKYEIKKYEEKEIEIRREEYNFGGLNLEGVNLENIDLSHAVFFRTDLNNANLKKSNLSGANLKQAQLDNADLTGAVISGAFIEDWSITRSTKVDDIECQEIFMRLPNSIEPDPWRIPSNKDKYFTGNDFQVFIESVRDTLELYHKEEINANVSIAILKGMESKHCIKLEMISLENRGNNQFVLRLKVNNEHGRISHSQIRDEYYSNYEQTLPVYISDPSILNVVKNEILVGKIVVEQGDLIMRDKIVDKSRKIIARDITSHGAGSINLGTISGTVANAIGQLPDSDDPNRSGIKELLTALQAAIENDSDLQPEDKADALEQIKILAEIGNDPEQPEKEGNGRRAIKFLQMTVKSLPDTAKIVEACGKLLPLIGTALGLHG